MVILEEVFGVEIVNEHLYENEQEPKRTRCPNKFWTDKTNILKVCLHSSKVVKMSLHFDELI